MRWALALGALALLCQGCAAGPGLRSGSAAGGSGAYLHGPPEDDATRQQARHTEAQRALAQMWAVASTSDAPGTELEFRYWAHDGTLTLRSFQRLREGQGHGHPVDRATFAPGLARELPTLLGRQAREVTFTLEREALGWEADFRTRSAPAPPEARTLPHTRPGVPSEVYQQALATAQALARLLEVPRGGQAHLEVEVTLEDERITGWEPTQVDSLGEGPRLAAPPSAVSEVAHLLLPFTQALGPRTVRLELEGTHRPREAAPRWRVRQAQTRPPPPPPEELEDFAREYRAMHERILHDWREQVWAEAQRAGLYTLEQLAYWYVGGWLTKRALGLFESAAPTITSVLSQGGSRAVGWFRTVLLRAPAAEREALQRLWLKAEAHGLHALTTAERAQLRALLGRLEHLLRVPLREGSAKATLRQWARADYFKKHNPQLASELGEELLENYDVHHLLPLEYAHLFPRLDINGSANLAGVARPVHASLGKVWTVVRNASQPLTAEDVNSIAAIVNTHYRRWYHAVYDPARSASALSEAERAATRAVLAFLKHRA
jgi:hypothetical protein